MQPIKVKNSDIYDYLDEYRYQNMDSLEQFLLNLTLQKPFDDYKFYVFSFLKHNLKGENEKSLLHQPRLTKPEPVEGSMLFRLDPKKVGDVEVIWILPDKQGIKLFEKGKIFEDELINESIRKFQKNKEDLRRKAWDDLPDWMIKEIYKKN